MAITTAQYELSTTTPTRICGPDKNPLKVTIHNLESSTGKKVYIGNSGVTTSNSLEMNPSVFFQFVLDPGDDLWAVSNTADVRVGVLVQNQD